jgi:hypothetical protein
MSLVPCEPTGSRFSTPGFTPGFAPDSRSNLISLYHIRSGRIAHRFNANVVHGRTPSHSIPIPTDRPFKARPLQESLTRNFILLRRIPRSFRPS